MLTLLLLLLFVFTSNAYLNEVASTAYRGDIVSENIGRGVITTLSSSDSATSSSSNNAYTIANQPGTYKIMLMQLADNGIASGFVRDY